MRGRDIRQQRREAEAQKYIGFTPADEGIYCRECGHTDLAYLTQYANGSEYRCRRCGTVQMWDKRQPWEEPEDTDDE